jgi:hypothetical protein
MNTVQLEASVEVPYLSENEIEKQAALLLADVRRQNISDIRFGKLREYLAHLV